MTRRKEMSRAQGWRPGWIWQRGSTRWWNCRSGRTWKNGVMSFPACGFRRPGQQERTMEALTFASLLDLQMPERCQSNRLTRRLQSCLKRLETGCFERWLHMFHMSSSDIKTYHSHVCWQHSLPHFFCSLLGCSISMILGEIWTWACHRMASVLTSARQPNKNDGKGEPLLLAKPLKFHHQLQRHLETSWNIKPNSFDHPTSSFCQVLFPFLRNVKPWPFGLARMWGRGPCALVLSLRCI